LFKEDYINEKKGIQALKELLHEDKRFGFSMPLVRNLVNRYPPILRSLKMKSLASSKHLMVMVLIR